jgi:hypothetical protein
VGRIEHAPLDGGRASAPTDLRPSPANPTIPQKVTNVSNVLGRVQVLWNKRANKRAYVVALKTVEGR